MSNENIPYEQAPLSFWQGLMSNENIIVRFVPMRELALNKTYQLIVTGLPGPNGPVNSSPFTFRVATTLTITDPDGDTATLSLTARRGFGYFQTLGSKNEVSIETLEFRTTISGTGTDVSLSGSMRRGRRTDGIVTPPPSFAIELSPGTTFRSTLSSRRIQIGPLPRILVEQLLAASNGTLAGVLRSLP